MVASKCTVSDNLIIKEILLKYSLLFLLMTLLSFTALAQVFQGGNIKVQSLRFSENAVYVRFSPALDACEGR